MRSIKNSCCFLNIVFFLIQFSVLSAQTSLYDKPVSLNCNDKPLKEVLKDITSQTGIKFSYSPNKIPENEKVTASLSGVALNDALDKVFVSLPVKYEMVDGYIILKKGPGLVFTTKEEQGLKYTFSGYIKDSNSGEFLLGSTVYLKEIESGTITNNYGFFSMTVPVGRYSVIVSYIGYEDLEQGINLVSNLKSDFSMKDRPQSLKEVTITSVRKEEMVFNMHASQSKVMPSLVKKQPSLLGESDVLKTLEFQPGIAFYGDGSSYFHVRGGNYDQNLILLDEAILFNPSHLLGIFSPIIPEAVHSVDIYKADYPVNYGGRLSSVIDIRTKDGNKNRFSASGSLGLISARSTVEGPFKKDASSFFVSFRRSYFDLFLKKQIPDLLNLYFYDFTTKVNIKIRRRDRIFFTLYRGEDIFRVRAGESDSRGINWGNTALTLRWNHIFGSKFFTNTTFFASEYKYYLYSSIKDDKYWNSKIGNASLKHEVTFFVTPRMTWKAGIKVGSYNFNPGNYHTRENEGNYQVSPVNSVEATLFAGAEHEVSPWLKLNYGLRFTSWTDHGEAFVIDYAYYMPIDTNYYLKDEKYYEHQSVEPRLSASIKTGIVSSIKASYSRTSQYLNLITNSISPFNSLEVWMPAGPNIKPQFADIYDVGFVRAFTKTKLNFQTDIYYKKLYNQIGYKYHANMLVNPAVEGEIRQGSGYSYGFEIAIQRETGKISGQIAYTYSRAFLNIESLNEGRTFPASFDRPHNFNLSLVFQARPRWQISGNLNIASGARITTPTSFYYYRGYQVPVFTEQNNDRLPLYKRFDISTTVDLNKVFRKFKHSITFAVYNLAGQENPIFLYFNKTVNGDGELVVPADQMNTRELTPSIRYTFIVMPSLTYKFQF